MCDVPKLARYTTVNEETGKRKIKFIGRLDMSYEEAKSKYGDDLVLIPCGCCASCLKQYAFQWSTRLMAESLYHQNSCFLTLTYDHKHLPRKNVMDNNGEVFTIHPLVKKDLQDFIKRLRFHVQVPIRYFACGEYGDIGGRPHYHVILFGYDFEDKQVVSWNKLGQKLYTSKTLESIWQNGLVGIGEVTAESCGYVARYSLKKRTKLEKSDEFVLMSRRPGIGFQFFQDHKDLIYQTDRIYNPKFVSTSVPRAFDQYAESTIETDEPIWDYLSAKQARKRKALGNEYLSMIHYGVTHIEEAQVINYARRMESTKFLRRSL